MLETLKQRVCAENKRLSSTGLVIATWGNVSARCEETGHIVIKPSGVSYEEMTPEDMVVLSLAGEILEGKLKPSSDTKTHLVLYRQCEAIKSVVHTHSTYATIWAQVGNAIPPLGTTHGDDFYGEIPCTRSLTEEEIGSNYEENTGHLLMETLKQRHPVFNQGSSQSQQKDEKMALRKTPAILVKQHGPFVWSVSPEKAVEKALVLEEVAKMAWKCGCLGQMTPISQALQDQHFFRKQGEKSYYGQEGG